MSVSLPVPAVRRPASPRTELLRTYFLNACLIAMAKESGRAELRQRRFARIEEDERREFDGPLNGVPTV